MYLYTKGEVRVAIPAPQEVTEARNRLGELVAGAGDPLKLFNGEDVWTIMTGVSKGVVEEFATPQEVSQLPYCIAPELAPVWGVAEKGPVEELTQNARHAFRIGYFPDENRQRIVAEIRGDFGRHEEVPVWHIEMPSGRFPEGRANVPPYMAVDMNMPPPVNLAAWEVGSMPGSIDYDKRLRWFARIACRLVDENE